MPAVTIARCFARRAELANMSRGTRMRSRDNRLTDYDIALPEFRNRDDAPGNSSLIHWASKDVTTPYVSPSRTLVAVVGTSDTFRHGVHGPGCRVTALEFFLFSHSGEGQ